jgi:predicted adenylyl cyclase CyaB
MQQAFTGAGRVRLACQQGMPRRNIELKARLADLDAARRTACTLATSRLPDEHQTDTYFFCQHGRLKLREIQGGTAQLVEYLRDDVPGTRRSNYRLLEVSEPVLLREMLAAALGVRVVVEKQREIFLLEQTRIHLDQVRGLGSFLEFEAVLADGQSEVEGHEVVAKLTQTFGLRPHDFVPTSYADLLCAPPADSRNVR